MTTGAVALVLHRLSRDKDGRPLHVDRAPRTDPPHLTSAEAADAVATGAHSSIDRKEIRLLNEARSEPRLRELRRQLRAAGLKSHVASGE